MRNETDGSYSASVTIANYVMDHHFEQPWRLAVIWGEADTYCLNNVTLPRQNVRNCIGGTVIIPRLEKADLTKSSRSFQVSVSHSNRGYRGKLPSDVTLMTTRGIAYESECDSMEQVTDVHLNTWRTTCILSIAKATKFHKIHDTEEL
ncbi:hypothetical protein HID58_053502 [Brassica napus]|uniref:Uncharacterized protein n=1 Tax=Brassica napus TaxID=3708 RepID=A0ABQ8AFA4_BRANA|nr:hypothetical protein HID58_053502 [Brassica napus]